MNILTSLLILFLIFTVAIGAGGVAWLQWVALATLLLWTLNTVYLLGKSRIEED